MEYVVWTRKPTDPDYMESVALETKSLQAAEHAIDALRSNGMVARLSSFDFSRPWNATKAFAATARK